MSMHKPAIPLPKEYQHALIRCYCHLGGKSVTKHFTPYIFGTRPDTLSTIINTNMMWEKIILAARAFCSIDNPADIIVVSSKEFGRKAVLRFCEYTGATPHTGRFIPGSFTNSVSKIKEPRLVLVSDPFTDKQTVKESAYVNVPCVAFCNTDNDTSLVDIVIPMNNRSLTAIGAGFCLLARVINYMKGKGSLTEGLKTEIERYFYRNVAEIEELAAEHEEHESNEVEESLD